MRLTSVALLTLFWICDGKASTTPRCFQFESNQSPENIELSAVLSQNDPTVWCYQDHDLGKRTFRSVFGYEDGRLVPGLAFLLEVDEKNEIQNFRASSLKKGKISYHGFSEQFTDLLPFPLDPFKNLENKGRRVPSPKNRNSEFEETFEMLLRADVPRGYTVEEGVFEKMLPDESLPYGAYWWPHSDLPLAGPENAPLTKYDRIVKAWTSNDPGSRAWELSNHSLQHVEWGGHCNGWAASSVLYSEIEEPRWEPESKTVLFTSDFNGMLAEASFCVKWAFYGFRYRNAEDDPLDIYPDKFHKVLLYYIDQMSKPVAFDYVRGASVDNNVITGYKFTVANEPNNPKTFRVKAQLKGHNYDSGIKEAIGVADVYWFNYEYLLHVNEANEIVSGEWISDNPDFLWVPLSQSRCGRENPFLNTKYIDQMMKLSPAGRVQMDLNLEKTLTMAADEVVPLFELPETHGASYIFEGVEITDPQTHLVYGVDHLPGTNGKVTLATRIENVSTLSVHNYNATEKTITVKIKSMSFLSEP